MTPLTQIFRAFLNLITDDMYTIFDTQASEQDMFNILQQIIPRFEFPRNPIFIEGGEDVDLSDPDFTVESMTMNRRLTQEEKNILANLMMELWLRRKIADQRVIVMEYGDKDFALKSQQAHLDVLNKTMEHFKEETHYMQRIYNRRRPDGTPNYVGLIG